ncbi:MAG: PAS domain-containing protein, partial [Victivallaceae bacterium]
MLFSPDAEFLIEQRPIADKIGILLFRLVIRVNALKVAYYRYDRNSGVFVPEFCGGEGFYAEKSNVIAGEKASLLRNFLTRRNIFYARSEVDCKKISTLQYCLSFEPDERDFFIGALKGQQQLQGALFVQFKSKKVPRIIYLRNIRQIMRLLTFVLNGEWQKCEEERQIRRLQHNNRTQQKLLANAQIARECFEVFTSESDSAKAMVAILEKISICFDMDFCSISQLKAGRLTEVATFRRGEGENCATPAYQKYPLLYAAAEQTRYISFNLDAPEVGCPCGSDGDAVMRENNCAAFLLYRVMVEGRSWGYITLLKRQNVVLPAGEINLLGMMVKSLELYLAKETIRSQLDAESAMKKDLFEIAPIPFILFDTNEQVLMMNRLAEELSQVKFSAQDKISCKKFFYGDDNDERDCPVWDALQDGKIKIRRMAVWGRKFDVYTRPILENGQLNGVLVSMLDQTELLQSKNHYRDTSMLFNRVIDTIPCIVALKDYYNGNKYIIANKFLHDFAGLTPGEIVGRDDREILMLNQNSDWAKEEAEAMRSGRLDALDVLRDKDGKRALFNSSLIRVPREDRTDLLLAIRFDVTEIHRSRIALEDNARELSKINRRLKTYLEQSQILRNCTESLACHVRGREPLSKLLHEVGCYLKADRCVVVHYKNSEYKYHSKWYASELVP